MGLEMEAVLLDLLVLHAEVPLPFVTAFLLSCLSGTWTFENTVISLYLLPPLSSMWLTSQLDSLHVANTADFQLSSCGLSTPWASQKRSSTVAFIQPMCCVLTPGLLGSASLCKQQHRGPLFPPYCLSSPTALPTCLVWSTFLVYPGYPTTLSTTSLLEQHPLLLGWLQEIKFSVTCLQSQEKCTQMQTYNWKLPWPLPSPKEYPSPQETFFILTGNKFL